MFIQKHLAKKPLYASCLPQISTYGHLLASQRMLPKLRWIETGPPGQISTRTFLFEAFASNPYERPSICTWILSNPRIEHLSAASSLINEVKSQRAFEDVGSTLWNSDSLFCIPIFLFNRGDQSITIHHNFGNLLKFSFWLWNLLR